MEKTTLEMFRKELLETGSYVTPAERKAPEPRKKSALTTLGYSYAVWSVFPKCGLTETFGNLTTDKWAHYCFLSVQKAEQYGTTVSFEGWLNRKNYTGPVVYVCNHMSTLETILTPFTLLTFGPFNVVVKSSLAHIPGLVKASAHMGLVPITRKSPKEDLMTLFKVGEERISRGESFLIFPQGSRYPVFSKRKFSSIGSKLAERSGVPVIPLAVKTDILPTRESGGIFKDFGTVDPSKDIRVACGPVLRGSAKEMQVASIDWIAGKLSEWGLPVSD